MSYFFNIFKVSSPLYTDGFSTKDIMYKWSDGQDSVKVRKGVSLPQLTFKGHRVRDKHETFISGKKTQLPSKVRGNSHFLFFIFTGNYSRLVLDLKLERSMGFYLLQVRYRCMHEYCTQAMCSTSDLRAIFLDRRCLLDLLLAEQRQTSGSGGTRSHNSADHNPAAGGDK